MINYTTLKLMEKYPNYQRYSFGQKVKDVAVELFDMKGKDRSLLVKIGGYMRDIDPDVWIDYLMKQIVDVDDCIIDDIRYQNELDALIDDNWIIIKLTISKELQALNTMTVRLVDRIRTLELNFIEHDETVRALYGLTRANRRRTRHETVEDLHEQIKDAGKTNGD